MLVAVAPMEQVQGFDANGKLVRVARHTAPSIGAGRIHPRNMRMLEAARIRSLQVIADFGADHARLLPIFGRPVDYDAPALAMYRTPRRGDSRAQEA